MQKLKLVSNQDQKSLNAFKAGRVYRDLFEREDDGKHGARLYAMGEEELKEKFMAGFMTGPCEV